MKKMLCAVAVATAVFASVSASARERIRAGKRRVRVRDAAYVTLADAAAELGLPGAAEGANGRVVLSDGFLMVVVCPGMSTALVDGHSVRMGGGLSADNDGILIPEYCLRQLKSAVAQARQREIRTIVIDAGHGGNDTGAIGRDGLREKDVNLAVALRLAELLKKRSIEVVLTRDTDVFIPLDERVRICNREKPDLFMSVHANASLSRDVEGVETFYVRAELDDLSRAKRAVKNGGREVEGVRLRTGDRLLGVALYHTLFGMSRRRSLEIGAMVNRRLWKGVAEKDRGVKEAGFRVLKGAQCPAVLVEIGFLSHPATERKLRSDKYLDEVARAIASGIR